VVGRVLSETIIPPQYREAHNRGLARFLATGGGPALNIDLLGVECPPQTFREESWPRRTLERKE
jgi:hypothetical protein